VNTAEVLRRAEQELEQGSARKALQLLQPLLDQANPDALFLYSTFSPADSETDSEFETRSVALLVQAAAQGHARATYALACCYESGDRVSRDEELAARLLETAAGLGFPRAKYAHALNLLHEGCGIEQDRVLAVSLLREAADEGVEEAGQELRDFPALGE
jgi:TPR repeat protein